MSNFTPLVEKEYEWQGDKITAHFARFKRKDMLSLMPAIQELNKAEDEGARAMGISNVLNLSLGLLPKYVKVFDGLKTKDGLDISIETVAEEMYFVDLAMEIAMDMLQESLVLMGQGAKNG